MASESGSALAAATMLSALVVPLAAVASLVALLHPALYRDNPLVTAGWAGNDLVTLVVAAPALAAALVGARRGSVRATLVWFGLLAYMVYNYAFYLFGAAFNSLFLVYAALFTASAFGLALGLSATDVRLLTRSVGYTAPVRAVALYMLAVGGLLGAFWGVTSLDYVLSGRVPAVVVAVEHPTNVVAALDLSMVVPLALFASHLLWRRQAWGFVLAVVWNVKGACYMGALSAASVTAWAAGPAASLAQLALWVPIGIGCAVSSFVLLRALPSGH